MFELKSLSPEAVPQSLERVERYRLLNEPVVAESICYDILQVDPDNQRALVMLILALTDQFADNPALGRAQVLDWIPKLVGEYEQAYYTGIVFERQAQARLKREYPGAGFDAYDLFRSAMEFFEKAEGLLPATNEDAVLRWNHCVRTIDRHSLQPRPRDDSDPGSE